MKTKRYFIGLLIVLSALCFSLPVFAESQQTSGVTAQTIIDRARYSISATGDSFFTDATEMLSWVNAGLFNIADATKCLEGTELVTLQTGVTQYAISSTTTYTSIDNAVYSGATTVSDSSPQKGLVRIDQAQIGNMPNSRTAGPPVYYAVWNDYFYVDPQPSSAVSGYKATLYLRERPTEIGLSGAIPTPAIYDDALVMYVASRAAIKDKRWDVASQLYALYTQIISFHGARSQGEKPK